MMTTANRAFRRFPSTGRVPAHATSAIFVLQARQNVKIGKKSSRVSINGDVVDVSTAEETEVSGTLPATLENLTGNRLVGEPPEVDVTVIVGENRRTLTLSAGERTEVTEDGFEEAPPKNDSLLPGTTQLALLLFLAAAVLLYFDFNTPDPRPARPRLPSLF